MVASSREERAPVQHTVRSGRCPCSTSMGRELRECPACREKTLHNVGFGIDREAICEKGCSQLDRSAAVLRFKADLKEARYQFERREARRSRGGR